MTNEFGRVTSSGMQVGAPVKPSGLKRRSSSGFGEARPGSDNEETNAMGVAGRGAAL